MLFLSLVAGGQWIIASTRPEERASFIKSFSPRKNRSLIHVSDLPVLTECDARVSDLVSCLDQLSQGVSVSMRKAETQRRSFRRARRQKQKDESGIEDIWRKALKRTKGKTTFEPEPESDPDFEELELMHSLSIPRRACLLDEPFLMERGRWAVPTDEEEPADYNNLADEPSPKTPPRFNDDAEFREKQLESAGYHSDSEISNRDEFVQSNFTDRVSSSPIPISFDDSSPVSSFKSGNKRFIFDDFKTDMDSVIGSPEYVVEYEVASSRLLECDDSEENGTIDDNDGFMTSLEERQSGDTNVRCIQHNDETKEPLVNEGVEGHCVGSSAALKSCNAANSEAIGVKRSYETSISTSREGEIANVNAAFKGTKSRLNLKNLPPFSCKFCKSLLFPDVKRLYRHILKSHSLRCSRCDRSFFSKNLFEQHKNICVSYSCHFCQAPQRSLKSLKAHEECQHRAKRYCCRICAQRFRFRSTLKEHLLQHGSFTF